MFNLTKTEMKALLILLKEYNLDFNANSLSKTLGISSMGSLKILKKLQKKEMVFSKKLGNASFYKINYTDFSRSALDFILRNEIEDSPPEVKRWLKELQPIVKLSQLSLLFGSLLEKKEYNDVDLLLVMRKEDNARIDKKINEIQKVNIKKIHIVKQTMDDLSGNIRKSSGIIEEIVKKGIILSGFEEFIDLMENATKENRMVP